MQQVEDFREEGIELYKLLLTLDDLHWELATPFKNRTVNWVVNHLHDADRWAFHSVTDPDGFRQWVKQRATGTVLDPYRLSGKTLLNRWFTYLNELCDELLRVNPDLRAPWFGPDMGIRMMATARQMETWSHGQDVFDLLQVQRSNSDRVKNICHIGVRTFGWTYANRNLAIPDSIPYVELVSPSGATWKWNEPSKNNYVKGSAVEFAHVVTQGRNIHDVDLEHHGDIAESWMAIAQCFAGPPETPPPPGHRVWR